MGLRSKSKSQVKKWFLSQTLSQIKKWVTGQNVSQVKVGLGKNMGLRSKSGSQVRIGTQVKMVNPLSKSRSVVNRWV